MSRARAPAWLLTVVLVALVIAVFQVLVGRLLDPLWFATPSDVFSILARWLTSGALYPHLLTTITEIAIGFVVGVAIAIVLAVVLASSEVLGSATMPLVYAVNALPKVALIPLFVLIFGVGLESKIVLVAINVVFIVFLNLYTGLTTLNPRLRDVLALMGASPKEMLLKVKLPAALAWLLLGMRVSARYALAGAVVVELFSSNRGLGFLIANATAQLEPAQVFATILVLAVLGVAMTFVLQFFERALMSWRV